MEAILDRAHDVDAAVLFKLATDHIGPKVMASDLNYHHTTIYKMGASKKTNGETRKSPIFHTATIVKNLAKKGNRTLAVRIVDFFCRILGGRFVPNKPPIADKKTLAEELADNIPAFAEYTETRRNPEATREEQNAKLAAFIDELYQDFDESLK